MTRNHVHRAAAIVAAFVLSITGVVAVGAAGGPDDLADGTMESLGALPNSTPGFPEMAEAYGIDDDGVIVGDSGTTFENRVFRWTEAGGMEDLGAMGGTEAWARDINDHGVIVGWVLGDDGRERAYRWSDTDGVEWLGGQDGPHSRAYAINNDGVIVGDFTTAAGETRAFRWTESGGMENLGSLGAERSHAYGINNAGVIVGADQIVETTPFPRERSRAFRWTEAGGMEILDSFRNGYPDDNSVARDINDDGVIVGWGSGDDNLHWPFRWSEQDGVQDLGNLDGTRKFAYAYAINNAGVIVGWDGHGNGTAFRWTAANGMENLGSLGIDGLGAPGSSQAWAIDDAGVIVGRTSITGGGSHAFRWIAGSGQPPTTTSTTMPDVTTTTTSTSITTSTTIPDVTSTTVPDTTTSTVASTVPDRSPPRPTSTMPSTTDAPATRSAPDGPTPARVGTAVPAQPAFVG